MDRVSLMVRRDPISRFNTARRLLVIGTTTTVVGWTSLIAETVSLHLEFSCCCGVVSSAAALVALFVNLAVCCRADVLFEQSALEGGKRVAASLGIALLTILGWVPLVGILLCTGGSPER